MSWHLHWYEMLPRRVLLSKKKSTSEHLFWCSRLSQIEDSIQYLKGPNSTWMDHDGNLGVQMEECLCPDGPQDSYHGPSRYYKRTPRFVSWSFQVLFGPSRYWIESSIWDNLKHQKMCSEILFFVECTLLSCIVILVVMIGTNIFALQISIGLIRLPINIYSLRKWITLGKTNIDRWCCFTTLAYQWVLREHFLQFSHSYRLVSTRCQPKNRTVKYFELSDIRF